MMMTSQKDLLKKICLKKSYLMMNCLKRKRTCCSSAKKIHYWFPARKYFGWPLWWTVLNWKQ